MKTFHGRAIAALIAIAALGFCGSLQAQVQTESQPQPQKQAQPQKQPDTPASVRAGRFYAFGGFAALAADTNTQLQNEKGSPINLIAGGGYGVTPNIALEVHLLLASRDFDTPAQTTPPPGTYSPGSENSWMSTGGFGVTLKYVFLVDNFAPYVGAGAGIYTTTYRTITDAPLCSNNCVGTGPRISDHSTDIGAHAVLGADIHFTAKNILAVEVRYLKLKADFNEIGLGKMDAGGTFFWMGYRRIF